MRHAAIWGAVGLLLLPVVGDSRPAAGQDAAKLPPRYYALLVGVRQYDPNELRSLPYAEPDVEELSQLLTEQGFRRVVLMTQTVGAKQFRLLPTSRNIRTTLKGLLANKREQDVVLVALAGHGVQFKGEDAAYFCPMDAKLSDRKTLISLKEVYDALEACNAGARLLLVDACRNDPQSDNSRSAQGDRVDSITRPQRVKPPGGVAALFSCSAGQKAFESSELKHGIFFHAVIEGLRGKADFRKQDPLTWSELVTWTQAEVPDLVADIYGDGVRQDPELTGRMRGNIALLPAIRVPDRKMRLPTQPVPSESLGDDDTRKAGTIRADNGLKLKLVWCPAGSFRMGSPESDEEADDNEQPQVNVMLTSGFWLGQTEVTQGQWKSVMGTEPWVEHGDTDRYKAGSTYPAVYISHEDALSFCRKLTSQERGAGRLPSDWEYTLPSEAQWEYACRAGTTTRYHFGDDASDLGDYAWIYENTGGVDEAYAHRVGQRRSNPWNLHDLHGNVWEWCRDVYDKTLAGGRDPLFTSGAMHRVSRGGGRYGSCRSADRDWFITSVRYDYLGFRLASVPSGQ